jgi:hypothetical protein
MKKGISLTALALFAVIGAFALRPQTALACGYPLLPNLSGADARLTICFNSLRELAFLH